MNLKRFSLILCTILGMLVLLAVVDVIAQTLGSARSVKGNKISDVRAVVEQFWEDAQAGRLEKAKSLKTDTNEQVTIVIENDEHPWERVIHETNMRLIKSLDEKCVNDRKCIVPTNVRNSHGKEIRLYHTLVKDEGVWRILYITF